MGALAAFGLRSLMDDANNYWNPSLPIYYRTKNFSVANESPAVNELGFSYTPVNGRTDVGYTDTQITPPPGIKQLTLKQMSDAQAIGAVLRFGARVLTFTHTWVAAMQALKGYGDPKQVFTDPSVIGIYHDGLLFEIVSYVHNDLYGQIISWDVICNSNEVK